MSARKYHKLLSEGGELFVNRMGALWTVDVFPAEWVPSDGDPIYHAAYDNEAAALADAELWAPWPL